MPEGSAQPNYNKEPQDDIGADLARDKAEKIAQLRTPPANNTVPEENYEPYSKPENDNGTSYDSKPANDTTAPDNGYEDEEKEQGQTATQQAQQQEQLNTEQQENVATSLAGQKTRQLLQIAREVAKLEQQLGELEKDLTSFRNSPLGGFLKIFQPRITTLVNSLTEQLEKSAGNLSDEAKVSYYNGLITTASSLINTLRAFKFITAVLDAAFVDGFSCLRLVISTFSTCIIPIILILISPLYIPFLAIIFMLGKIPLLKGVLTKNIGDLIEKLKGHRTAWQAKLEIVQKKVTLRKQIKALKATEKQIKRQG